MTALLDLMADCLFWCAVTAAVVSAGVLGIAVLCYGVDVLQRRREARDCEQDELELLFAEPAYGEEAKR